MWLAIHLSSANNDRVWFVDKATDKWTTKKLDLLRYLIFINKHIVWYDVQQLFIIPNDQHCPRWGLLCTLNKFHNLFIQILSGTCSKMAHISTMWKGAKTRTVTDILQNWKKIFTVVKVQIFIFFACKQNTKVFWRVFWIEWYVIWYINTQRWCRLSHNMNSLAGSIQLCNKLTYTDDTYIIAKLKLCP